MPKNDLIDVKPTTTKQLSTTIYGVMFEFGATKCLKAYESNEDAMKYLNEYINTHPDRTWLTKVNDHHYKLLDDKHIYIEAITLYHKLIENKPFELEATHVINNSLNTNLANNA